MSRRGLKITSLVLGLFLLTLGGLTLAAWQITRSQAFRGWLIERLQQEVAQATGVRLELAALEGSLLLDARVKGLALIKDGRRLLAADEISLRYNLLALLGGRLHITSLQARRPRVSLPWDLAGQGGGGPPPLALSLHDVVVQDGTLETGGSLGPLQKGRGVDLAGSLDLDALGLQFTVQVQRGQAHLSGLSGPLAVQGAGSWQDQRLRIERLSVASGPNRAQLAGEVDFARELRLKLRATARGLQVAALPLAWPLPEPPRQPLNLELAASGPLARLQLRGRVQMAQAQVWLEGWCDVLKGALQLQADLKGVSLSQWGLVQLPLTLQGRVQATADAWPGQGGAHLRLGLELSQVQYQQMQAGPLRLQARLEKERLHLDSFSLQSAWGSLSGSGQLRLPLDGRPWRTMGQVHFRQLSAPPLLMAKVPRQLRQARLNGQVEFSGTQQDLDLKLTLEPSRLAPELEVKRLEAQGGLKQGRWHLARLRLESPLASLEAQGRAGWEDGELEFSLRVPDLSDLGDHLGRHKLALPLELDGDLEAKGVIKGPWRSPHLAGRLKVKRLVTRHAWVGRAEMDFDLRNLGRRPVGWAKLKTRFVISGELFLARAQVHTELGGDRQKLTLEAHGPEVSLGLTLTSHKLFKLPLQADLNKLWLVRPELGRWSQQGQAQVLLGRQEVRVQGLVLGQDGQRLSLEGRVDPVGGAVQAAVNLRGLRLARLLAEKGTLPPQTELSGRGRLSGSLDQPVLKIGGRLSGLHWPGLPPAEVEFQGSYGQEMLRLKGRARQDGRLLAELDARLGFTLSLRPPVWEATHEGLRLQARAQDLSLEMLQPLLRGVSGLQGKASLGLEVSGSPRQPQVQGRLQVKDGSLIIDATGQEVGGIQMLLTLRGQRVSVERCSAQAGGELKVQGHLDLPLRGPGGLDLKLSTQEVKVSLGTMGQMTTQADLSLGGSFARPVLRGSVRPSRLMIAFALTTPPGLEDVVILQPGQKPPPLSKSEEKFRLPPVLDPLAMQVRAELADPTRVSLSDGWLQTRGSLLLKKEPGGPLTFHEGIVVDKGLIIILGKRFEILEGGANFRGRPEPNPDLEAEAQLNMGTTTVFINVAGTAKDPQLNLSSLPPMSQTDILSTIIFGRPANKLSGGQSRELSAQALALLGAAGRKELESLFGPDISPDVVTVHNAPATGSSLEAGKYLNEQLYVRYRQNLGPYGGQSVGLEYRFSRDFAVESQMGSSRDSGVDLVFSKDLDFSPRDKEQEPGEKDQKKEKRPGRP